MLQRHEGTTSSGRRDLKRDVSGDRIAITYESLLVIIPALNEERTIERVVTQTRDCSDQLAELGLRLQICVIDDGSRDETAVAARRAGVDDVIIHKLNRGCGAAVRSGLLHGRSHGAGIVVKLDADGQHDPADIPALIRPILEDRADVVYGNRFPRLSYRMSFVRRVGNTVFRTLIRWLTHWDIKDSQPGMFAVNASYLKVSFIPGDYNYTQQVLLDSYLNGMRFEQVPVAFHRTPDACASRSCRRWHGSPRPAGFPRQAGLRTCEIPDADGAPDTSR